jgi:hypothetical protein
MSNGFTLSQQQIDSHCWGVFIVFIIVWVIVIIKHLKGVETEAIESERRKIGEQIARTKNVTDERYSLIPEEKLQEMETFLSDPILLTKSGF